MVFPMPTGWSEAIITCPLNIREKNSNQAPSGNKPAVGGHKDCYKAWLNLVHGSETWSAQVPILSTWYIALPYDAIGMISIPDSPLKFCLRVIPNWGRSPVKVVKGPLNWRSKDWDGILPVWTWMCHFPVLGLSFLICKMKRRDKVTDSSSELTHQTLLIWNTSNT